MQFEQLASQFFPYLIGACAAFNVLIWFWLIFRARSQKAHLADFLWNVVRELRNRSDDMHSVSLDERINVFIADIRDAVESPADREESQGLLHRLMTKDEARLYLKTHTFERWYSVARTFIEIFPLLGIIGTVLAIWAGMSSTGLNDADKVSRVVQNFSHSVVSTAVGLLAAIIFMGVNSWFEPGFERLMGYSDAIREIVAHAKKKLGFAVAEGQEKP